MLNFFRKHQKIFFLLTTIIIVISFVFFGTYQAFAPSFNRSGEDEESYAAQVARFLDTEQWMISRKFFSTNFLNDGVISKEFLETGMAAQVINANLKTYQQNFLDLFENEKKYSPYTHPFIPSLSAMSMWSIFAPDLPQKLKAHLNSHGAFKERNELFLAQKNFPPAFLSQIIRYQEKNQANFPSDSRLAREDIALFNYHSFSDWFGPRFVENLAELIIKTAEIARKEGYKVTQDELMAELVSRSQEVYNGLKQKVELPVEDGYGLFKVYLKQIGMREQTVLKIWEDVTLFRRLMHSIGNASLTDSLPLSQFYAFAYENATIELYQMPTTLRLTTTEDLKRFEIYLAAVGEKRIAPLDIPQEYASIDEIEKRAPELVGKKYQISISEVSKHALLAKVSIKETLDWECNPENQHILQRQFPELANKNGSLFEILEEMDEKGRKLIDSFARKQIVEAHPEWIDEALLASEMNEHTLFLNELTEKPLQGITNTSHFIEVLDSQNEIANFSQDKQHYYRILVKERGENKVPLTYKEALKRGVLDKLFQSLQGDSLVQAILDATPTEYKKQANAYRFAQHVLKSRYTQPSGQLIEQFLVEKKEKTIARSERTFISIDEVLNLQPGSFSPIKIDPKEGAYLYRFIEKKADKTLPVEKMIKIQELISKEARCRYFEKLIASTL